MPEEKPVLAMVYTCEALHELMRREIEADGIARVVRFDWVNNPTRVIVQFERVAPVPQEGAR